MANKDGSPCETIKADGEEFYDELVLSQEAQALPFAIVEFDPIKLRSETQKFARIVATGNYPERELREERV